MLSEIPIRELRNFSAFFIKEDVIYPIKITHIDFILSNPEMFSLTMKDIQGVYQKYHEKIGIEGKARVEVIKIAAKSGWIRIRHYLAPRDYWTIQFDKWADRQREVLNFIECCVSELKIMNQDDEINLLGYDDDFNKKCSYVDVIQEAFYGDILKQQIRDI